MPPTPKTKAVRKRETLCQTNVDSAKRVKSRRHPCPLCCRCLRIRSKGVHCPSYRHCRAPSKANRVNFPCSAYQCFPRGGRGKRKHSKLLRKDTPVPSRLHPLLCHNAWLSFPAAPVDTTRRGCPHLTRKLSQKVVEVVSDHVELFLFRSSSRTLFTAVPTVGLARTSTSPYRQRG